MVAPVHAPQGKIQLFREIIPCPIGKYVFKDKEGNKRLQGYSFLIKSVSKVYVDGRDRQLWFKSENAAKQCADHIMANVMEQLKAQGAKVEAFTQ